MRISVYIATSLDGFIARENGALDWLPGANTESGGEDYGYGEFMAAVDTLVMGRNTFESVMRFAEWPYGQKPVVVLSHRPVAIPGNLAATVETLSCSPAELVERLAARGAKHVYVDGGKTIQGFLRGGLIDEIIITRVPVLLGAGLPLFGPLERDLRLLHLATRAYPNGLVQSRYAVERRAAL
jgi:dihydrofolate reductase